MNEKARKIAQRIEKLKREFSMLPTLEERHSALEIEEYQHYLLELEENVIVFKYLLENTKDEAGTNVTPKIEQREDLAVENEAEPAHSVENKESTSVETEIEENANPIAETTSQNEISEVEAEQNEPSSKDEPEALVENENAMEKEKEKILSTGESFNDKIQSEDNSLATKLAKSPIADLRKAFGLNERFFYTNELFGGDGQEFVRALNELNHLETFADAERLIKARYEKNFNWNKEDETVLSFIEVVERRYL
jgi:hypothetical protein